MRQDELLLPWYACLCEGLPGIAPFDVHTHTGRNDPSGVRLAAEELVDALELLSARGVVFPLQEPGGYPAANDRVLAEAEASDGRLVAFCRVDPHDRALVEARRCLDRGARGIKLHPRAEGFGLDDPTVRDIFGLAQERMVPVLVHAGGDAVGVGHQALALTAALPDARVILAHAALSDLAAIWERAPERPNLFFDTGWWNATDVAALFALIPPGQVLFGSDAPYETPLTNAIVTLRCALQVGLSSKQVESVMGAQLDRLLRGDEPIDLGPAPGPASLRSTVLLDRVHSNLVAAVAQMRIGASGAEGRMLARYACEVRDDAPERRLCHSIAALLERCERFIDEDHERGQVPHASGYPLTVVAAALARTPDVALPAEPSDVSVGAPGPSPQDS